MLVTIFSSLSLGSWTAEILAMFSRVRVRRGDSAV
jgi:hypothetical protein